MGFSEVNQRGLVLLGGGKMGLAMLTGWLDEGLDPKASFVIDPNPQAALSALNVCINETLPNAPAVVILAVKPQIMEEGIKQIAQFSGSDTVFISVAAGLTLDWFAGRLGGEAAVIRCIPNTPAAIGQGITGFIGNANTTLSQVDLARQLLSAMGEVVALDREEQMDAVTALSGSGPAYVFHMIEAMSGAAQKLGLPQDMADKLALATVSGAGALAKASAEDAARLRQNVTSPNGTTQAGLEVLMRDEAGLMALMDQTIKAACERSKELSSG